MSKRKPVLYAIEQGYSDDYSIVAIFTKRREAFAFLNHWKEVEEAVNELARDTDNAALCMTGMSGLTGVREIRPTSGPTLIEVEVHLQDWKEKDPVVCVRAAEGPRPKHTWKDDPTGPVLTYYYRTVNPLGVKHGLKLARTYFQRNYASHGLKAEAKKGKP